MGRPRYDEPMTANPTLTTRTTTGSLHLALLLALAGGFLDAFTFVGHGGVFANAQTGNVVLLAVGAATGHWGANLRTATRAAYGALLLREPGAAEQARCFAAISFAFLAGASVGAFATHHLLNHAAWLAALLLSIALSTFVVDEWLATGGASPSD